MELPIKAKKSKVNKLKSAPPAANSHEPVPKHPVPPSFEQGRVVDKGQGSNSSNSNNNLSFPSREPGAEEPANPGIIEESKGRLDSGAGVLTKENSRGIGNSSRGDELQPSYPDVANKLGNSSGGDGNNNGIQILLLHLNDKLSLDDPTVIQQLVAQLKAFQTQGGNEVVMISSQRPITRVDVVELGRITSLDVPLPNNQVTTDQVETTSSVEMEINVVSLSSPDDKREHEKLENSEVASPAIASTATRKDNMEGKETSHAQKSEIPEIAELERQLAAIPEEDVEQKRQFIKAWVRGLQSAEASKNEGVETESREEKKRRQRKEVAQDEEIVEEWVRSLNPLFQCLTDQTINISQASRDFGVAQAVISGWKDNDILKIVDIEKNRILVDTKVVAILAAINRKFGGNGRRLAKYAVNVYFDL
jgi:hypothetical protein